MRFQSRERTNRASLLSVEACAAQSAIIFLNDSRLFKVRTSFISQRVLNYNSRRVLSNFMIQAMMLDLFHQSLIPIR
jgi:hypothetical protein